MKVLFTFKDLDEIPFGVIGDHFVISNVYASQNKYGRNVLSLELKGTLSGRKKRQAILGDQVRKLFLIDMGVSRIEELAGKEVLGFIDKRSGERWLVPPLLALAITFKNPISQV